MKGRARILASIFLAILFGCSDIAPVVTVYEPARVDPGYTMAYVNSNRTFVLLDFSGNIVWSLEDLSIRAISDFEILESGDMLYIKAAGAPCIYSLSDGPLYVGPNILADHSLLLLPWGNILAITVEMVDVGGWMGWIGSNSIVELDPTRNEIVWEWKFHEHVNPLEHYRAYTLADWSHANAIHFYEDFPEGRNSILFNPRNLSTFYLISYPDGEILRACGDEGTFGAGLFAGPHDPYFLPDGNVLLFDNGRWRIPHFSRALELAVDPERREAEIAWQYRETPDFFSDIMGDANRLSNGNTLVVDATSGRLVEVTREGEKVWEATLFWDRTIGANHTIYKAERVPCALYPQFGGNR